MAAGIDGGEYDKLSKSFGINSLLRKNNEIIEKPIYELSADFYCKR